MGENWMCLRCGDVYCSRYVNGHGLCHWEETAAAAAASTTNDERNKSGHCVMVSLTDLSVWCNVCGAYLVHDSLKPIVKQLQQIKFPEEAKGAEQVCKKAKSTE
jgi:Zn-finger in ubiquitin-hydrolases and other protein